MSEHDYRGSAGYGTKQDPASVPSGAERAAAQDARRDLLVRLPPGRALDHDDVVNLLDEGNQTARAIALRGRLLAEIHRSLPAGVLLTRDELDRVRAWAIDHPTRPGAAHGVDEWPPSR